MKFNPSSDRSSKNVRKLNLEQLENRRLFAGDVAFYDLNKTGNAVFEESVVVGNKLFFTDISDTTGEELYVYDFDTSTKSLVADINPGVGDSGVNDADYIVAGNKLFFNAFDPTNGTKMRWIDTTDSSYQINVLPTQISEKYFFESDQINTYAIVNNKLYFSGLDSASGNELRWVDLSSATLAVQTLDIYAGSSSSSPGEYGGFFSVGNRLYFSASAADGNELRWIDTSLTTPVLNSLDINSGIFSSYAGYRSGYELVGNKLYFNASTFSEGYELRWIDVTATTPTVNTISIYSGSFGSEPGYYSGLAVIGNRMFFDATNTGQGRELRWIDLTLSTPIVNSIEIYSGVFGSEPGRYGGFEVIGDRLFFSAASSTTGTELRWIDGAATTVTVNTVEINAGSTSSIGSYSENFERVADRLFFAASTSQGQELAWLDGAASTITINTIDLLPGSSSSFAVSQGELMSVAGKLVFYATDSSSVNSLKVLDPLAANPAVVDTIPLTNSGNGSNQGLYTGYIQAGSKVYFLGSNGLNWIDQSVNPWELRTINLSAYQNSPNNLTLVGDKLYFSAQTNSTEAFSIRWIDTTLTDPVLNTISVASGANVGNAGVFGGLVKAGSRLFFTAHDPINGTELRWIDTTSQSPVVNTINIDGSASSSNPGFNSGLTLVGSKLYFDATDAANGNTLRWLDVEEAVPTVRTIALNAGVNAAVGRYSGLFATNNKLYFNSQGFDGTQLRWIDSTEASPLVRTAASFSYGSSPVYPGQFGGFTAVGNKLFFFASDTSRGSELRWIDTSLTSPTLNTIEIESGSTGSVTTNNGGFQVIGTKIYFAAKSTAIGNELRWIDASLATPVLNSINLDGSSFDSNPGVGTGYMVLGSTLYFGANGTLRSIDTAAANPTVQNTSIANTFASAVNAAGLINGVTYLKNFHGYLFLPAARTGTGTELAIYQLSEAPTSLGLTSTSIEENTPIGTVVGELVTVDPDTTAGLKVEFVSGAGDDDNASTLHSRLLGISLSLSLQRTSKSNRAIVCDFERRIHSMHTWSKTSTSTLKTLMKPVP
jgi:ELWxxDGT repeat protein